MVLNATSVEVGRSNKFFLCICSRNCIFDVIIIIVIIIIIIIIMY